MNDFNYYLLVTFLGYQIILQILIPNEAEIRV